MIDHLSGGVTDLDHSRRFYDAVLRPLGLVRILDFDGRGSDYGAMAAPFGVEFTITVEASVSPLGGNAHLLPCTESRCGSRLPRVGPQNRRPATMAFPTFARTTTPTTTARSFSIQTVI